ncbi:MAG TPA: AMP-binding protein [Xanthomonadaceae bacterium]|nr:AMP-binding protein [Xanthomonadaceae bacterium]
MSAIIESGGAVGAVATPAAARGRAGPIPSGDPTRVVAFDGGGAVTAATFVRHVHGVVARLRDVPFAHGSCVVNLCEDRYRFLVALCAVALRGQATLLPPSRAPAAVDEVLAGNAGAWSIGDSEPGLPAPRHWCLPDQLPEADGDPFHPADDSLAVVGFTSGSTGAPQPQPKRWGSFRDSTAQNIAALRGLWASDTPPFVVATVPPQHMYGMELSVLLPLLGDAAVHAARPLFPADVARALADARAPRLLVTTPVHLRALLGAGIALPPLAGIVSATAPLSPELAAAAESRFGCEVRELFGSTETCIVAARRTARDPAWTPLPGVAFHPRPDGTLVSAPHLDGPTRLADLVELQPDGRFLLRGRHADLVEIAGKRASLADLTRRLLAVPGVEDGVVLQLDAAGPDGVRRIAALVVAPDINESAILAALRVGIDPVFLPRPLRRVAGLPRNETGKLPRSLLLDLLA